MVRISSMIKHLLQWSIAHFTLGTKVQVLGLILYIRCSVCNLLGTMEEFGHPEVSDMICILQHSTSNAKSSLSREPKLLDPR